MNNRGLVLWITGVSGAGKTSLATAICKNLKADGVPTVHVDGDAVREIVGDGLGHSDQERLTNAFRLCRMCQFLQSQGLFVVCSTMSLYPQVWEWNRANLPEYFEVYLKADLSLVRSVDAKGIYAKSLSGEESNVVGIDLPFMEPTTPDLILGALSLPPESLAEQVLKAVKTETK